MKIETEKMENKRTEQEKLILDNYEWDLLIKQLSSIVSKSEILLRTDNVNVKKVKTEQIKEKALECLNIVKYKDLKK